MPDTSDTIVPASTGARRFGCLARIALATGIVLALLGGWFAWMVHGEPSSPPMPVSAGTFPEEAPLMANPPRVVENDTPDGASRAPDSLTSIAPSGRPDTPDGATAEPVHPPEPPPPLPQPPPPAPLGPGGWVAELIARDLLVPVAGVTRPNLDDSFKDARGGGRSHEAIDILAPRNTPVLAVEDGTIAKLFTSVPGGLTIYQFDSAGRYCYYYAHLESYARGLRQGNRVRRGEVIGFVGTSGNAPRDTPHLHFAIYRLGPDQRWWEGDAINPFPVLRGRS